MARFAWVGTVGSGEDTEAQVYELQFKPPYQQVMPASNRNLQRTWSRLFNGADASAVRDIVAFLREHQGAVPFSWMTPDGEDVRVRCKSWRWVDRGDGRRDLSATFLEWPV
jgi:phage-related protein